MAILGCVETLAWIVLEALTHNILTLPQLVLENNVGLILVHKLIDRCLHRPKRGLTWRVLACKASTTSEAHRVRKIHRHTHLRNDRVYEKEAATQVSEVNMVRREQVRA
eukprot:3506388-Amphidinium_carterae.1